MSSEFQKGYLINERYRVISTLGSGGMGQVYQVEDIELYNQVLALKTIRENLAEDQTIFNRFRSEVLIARSLVHPGIVQVYDLAKAKEGFYYITMEYVEGETLKTKLEGQKKEVTLSLAGKPSFYYQEISNILEQLLQAIHYAHQKGVIHRDIKPANIILTKDNKVKLLDFGTARLLEKNLDLTTTGQAIGTPLYMSPEQIRGEKVDARCDIYAIGILSYELVTGSKPFEAENQMVAMYKQLNLEISEEVLRKFLMPANFIAAVIQATQKDQNKRFNSAEDFLKAITEKKQATIADNFKEKKSTNKYQKIVLFVTILLGFLAYLNYFLLSKKENNKQITDNKIALIPTSSTTSSTSTTIPTTSTSITSSSTTSTSLTSTTTTSATTVPQTTTSTLKQAVASQESAKVSFMLREENGNLITNDKIPIDLISKLRVIIQINDLSSSERNLADPSEFKVTLSKSSNQEKRLAPVKIISRGSSYEESIRLGTDIFSRIKEKDFFTEDTYQLDLIYQNKSIGNKKIELTLSPENQGSNKNNPLPPQPPPPPRKH